MDKTLHTPDGQPGAAGERRAQFLRFVQRLDECLEPHLGRIAYGNLRRQVFDGHESLDDTSNVAIVYETPGGSTDQINVVYEHHTGTFHMVQEHEEFTDHNPERVLESIRRRINAIPRKRQRRLREQVDRWLNEGRSRGQMFAEVNRLLQSGLRGGSITAAEMRDVVRYIVRKHTHRPLNPQ